MIPLDLAAGRSRGAGDERRRTNMKLKQRSEDDQTSNASKEKKMRY